jgi:hypothetical protein
MDKNVPGGCINGVQIFSMNVRKKRGMLKFLEKSAIFTMASDTPFRGFPDFFFCLFAELAKREQDLIFILLMSAF